MPELDEFGIPIKKSSQTIEQVDDFGIPIKKKESTPSPSLDAQSQLPLQKPKSLVPSAEPFLGNTLQEAVAKDKTPKTNWAAAKYNDLVGVLSSTLGGLASLQEKRYNVGLEKAMELSGETEQRKAMMREKAFIKGSGEKVKESVEKLRSRASDKEYEEKINKIDISNGVQMSDLGGVLNSAPAQIVNMVATAATYGANNYLQSVDNAISEIEKSPNADKFSESDKLLYANTQGLVQAALEYLPIGAMLSKTGLGSTVKNAITKTVLNNFVKKGVKATAKELEEAVTKEVSSFSKKAMRVGYNAAFGILAESPTEVLQQGASDGIKLAANAIKNNEIFDESDIRKNFWKNVGNAAVAGGAFGGAFGGGAGLMKNTNKAIRKEIAKAENQQDLQKIQNDLNYQVELGNLTQEEAKAAGITAQQYAEIASKIPAEIPKDKKYAIIGGIEQREKLKQDIELVKADEKSIDDAFPEYKQGKKDEIALLEGKLGQVNDYIESTVSDKEPKYIQKEGKFFKEVDGKQVEIPKQHYEAGKLVEIGKKQNEVTYEGQKWSIKEDLGDTVIIAKPNGSEIQVNKSELENINKETKIQQPTEAKIPTEEGSVSVEAKKADIERNVPDRANILNAAYKAQEFFPSETREELEKRLQDEINYINLLVKKLKERKVPDEKIIKQIKDYISNGSRVISRREGLSDFVTYLVENNTRISTDAELAALKTPKEEVKPTEAKEEGSVGVGGDVKQINILGSDISLDKPQRKDFTDGEIGDLEYANANMEHNKKVDEIIIGLNQDGILKDNQGNEYIVSITNQGVRIVNKMSDGTEGANFYYRKGKRVSKETPFTNGFSFKPKAVEQSLKEQPKQETKIETPKEEVKVEEVKPKEYVSKNGKHKIVYDEDGRLKVLEVKSGEEASTYMTKKIINEAADNFDFSKGKRAEFEEGLQLKDEKEADEYTLENTNNPIEVVEVYARQKPEGQPLSTVEQMIAEMGIGKITPESFKKYGDKNNIDSSIVFAYFKGKRGQKALPIDVVAKEMSDHYGVEIEPQDIVDFMVRFPKGEYSALKESENSVAVSAREKFEKLTGLPLTQEVAIKAIDYEFNKLAKEQQQLAEQQFRDEKELTDAYWNEQKGIVNVGEKGDNIKVEPPVKKRVGEKEAYKDLTRNEKRQIINSKFDELLKELKIEKICPT